MEEDSAAIRTVKWLVIDTDAGVDDAMAISMALQYAKSSSKNEDRFIVKAITTCFGNVDCPQVIKNVAKTRAANGLSADTGPDIFIGCHEPLTCARLDAKYFHGMDGLGNNSYPEEEISSSSSNNSNNSSRVTSAECFLKLCREVQEHNNNYIRHKHHSTGDGSNNSCYKIELTIVMLGPLTNLAVALECPEDRRLLLTNTTHLIIMGGCGNARGNLTRTTEFNVAADPEAADRVFRALEDEAKASLARAQTETEIKTEIEIEAGTVSSNASGSAACTTTTVTDTTTTTTTTTTTRGPAPVSSLVVATVVSWELCCTYPLSWALFDEMLPPAAASSDAGSENCNRGDSSREGGDSNRGVICNSSSSSDKDISADMQTDSYKGIRSRLQTFLYDISQQTYGHKQRLFLEMNTGAVICDVLAVAVGIALAMGDCGSDSDSDSGDRVRCIGCGSGGSERDESVDTYERKGSKVKNGKDVPFVEEYKPVHVEIELTGTLTRGQTVVDWGCYDGIQRVPNCHWITKINKQEYIRMFRAMFA